MNYSYALLLHHTSANKFTLDPSTSGATGGMTEIVYEYYVDIYQASCKNTESTFTITMAHPWPYKPSELMYSLAPACILIAQNAEV